MHVLLKKFRARILRFMVALPLLGASVTVLQNQ